VAGCVCEQVLDDALDHDGVERRHHRLCVYVQVTMVRMRHSSDWHSGKRREQSLLAAHGATPVEQCAGCPQDTAPPLLWQRGARPADMRHFTVRVAEAAEAVGVQPETKYARLEGDRIAYQVIGQGPPDLVLTSGAFTHVDMIWEEPTAALFFRRLASFSRLIRFDRRGSGASDPLPDPALPPWEAYAEELTAVLDAVGLERAALMATEQAGPMALFFAGTRPQRTGALILASTTARLVATDDYPIGMPEPVANAIVAHIDQLWGTEAMGRIIVPSRADDERLLRWGAKLQRAMASPKVVQAFMRALLEVDARPILPLIRSPTLVLHRRDFSLIPMAQGRYLAEHIPAARFVELPGADLLLWTEHQERVLDLVEEFLIGTRPRAEPTRVLATVLFTDIVGSTEQARRLGDRRWRELLDGHDELAHRLVEEAGGRLIKTTGDGILATFDGPGRGIRCAVALRGEPPSVFRSGPDCTPRRSNCATMTWPGLRCISPPG